MRDFAAVAAEYQTQVLDGTIPACKWVRLACDRNRRDVERQRTEAFPFWFDADAGVRVCQMAEMMPHIKGPKAFVTGVDAEGRHVWNTITLEPWQCWLLMVIFGWKRVADGLRRYRVAFTLVPRKNAKSTIAAVVMLFMLVADGESGAECYSAATTRDQAKVIAEIAWQMAKRSPSFRDYFGVKLGSETTRSLSVPATAGKFAPLSADFSNLDGLNVSFAAIDEFHAHKTRGVYDVLDTATGTRPQPLLFPITTAGVQLGGICHEKLQYLEKVLGGVVDDETFFGINYTIDEGDDIADPVVHRKANPNYGVSVRPDDLTRKIREASISPAAMNNVLTKHFNVWIRIESGWMEPSLWQRCTVDGLTIEALRAYPCWIGVDLAEVRDFAAVTLVFRLPESVYAVISRLYLPAATVRTLPVAQLAGWVKTGDVIETAGNQADFARIEADVLGFCDELDVQELDFDRALAAHMLQDIKSKLEPSMGRDEVEQFVVVVPQNVQTMDPAMKAVERLALSGRFQHDGNAAFGWMVSNVVTERNYQGEIYPRKAGGKDSHNKIDGPMAMFTALSRAYQPVVDEPSVYETRGLATVTV